VILEPDGLFDAGTPLPARQGAAIAQRFSEQRSDPAMAAIRHCRAGRGTALVHRGCALLRVAISEPGEEP